MWVLFLSVSLSHSLTLWCKMMRFRTLPRHRCVIYCGRGAYKQHSITRSNGITNFTYAVNEYSSQMLYYDGSSVDSSVHFPIWFHSPFFFLKHYSFSFYNIICLCRASSLAAFARVLPARNTVAKKKSRRKRMEISLKMWINQQQWKCCGDERLFNR